MTPSEEYCHGVHYDPFNVQPSVSLTLPDLENLGIAYVRLQWLDISSTSRCRVVPLAYFKKLLKSNRPGITVPNVVLGMVQVTVPEGFSAIGEYLFVIDTSTLAICSYEDKFVSCTGWFQKKTPVPGLDGQLQVSVDACPRTILHRVVENARLQVGVEFLVGIETEFILLKSTKPIAASSHHSYCTSDGLRTGSVESQVLREVADSLQVAGIELQVYHPEAVPGQYEIVTGPLLPLQAADAVVFTRDTIRNVAAKHGLRATFAPRVYPDGPGSSAHVHVSVHSANKDSKPRPSSTMSSHESSFLAGVLAHLTAMQAISMPIPASYGRVRDGVWSGGTFVCWGTENREAPIRLTNVNSPSARNLELRFADGTSNPYIVLAAMLGAGAHAIRQQAELKIKDCGEQKTAVQMSDREREECGITKKLAVNLEEARENFEQDEVMKEVLCGSFVQKYLAVNKTLADYLTQDKDEDEEELVRLVEFY